MEDMEMASAPQSDTAQKRDRHVLRLTLGWENNDADRRSINAELLRKIASYMDVIAENAPGDFQIVDMDMSTRWY
jgi:hypothetical protein